jgi:hypothetical protein
MLSHILCIYYALSIVPWYNIGKILSGRRKSRIEIEYRISNIEKRETGGQEKPDFEDRMSNVEKCEKGGEKGGAGGRNDNGIVFLLYSGSCVLRL